MDYSQLDEKQAMLLLNSLPKLGPISANRLLSKFENPLQILQASKDELLAVPGIGLKIVESLKNPENLNWIQNELIKIHRHSGRFIFGDELPLGLHEIADTPLGLYLKGEIPEGPYIAVVGTRIPSLYAQKVCQKITSELAKAGFCIVSGMARGIDAIAHQSALDSNGKTIAFLGCGIDVVYPPEHLSLYQKICESGAVLSEFPIGRKADRRTFPMRNRLVSGISSGVLVIESGTSGGSLITARFAAEQGRSVYAVPGRIDLPCSNGCNQLIRDGATLVTNAGEIIEELGPILSGFNFNKKSHETFNLIGNDHEGNEKLSLREQEVLKYFEEFGILSVEKVAMRSNLSIQEVSATLSMLELTNLVARRSDGRYEKL